MQLPKKHSYPFHPTAATRQRMDLVQGWRMTLGFNHVVSKLVPVEAFLGAKRICKVLLQTKSS